MTRPSQLLRPELPALLVSVLDALQDGHGLYVADPVVGVPSRIFGVYMNPAGLQLRGLTLEQFVGIDLLARTRAQGNDAAARAYADVLATGRPMVRRLVTDRLKGRTTTYEVNGVAVPAEVAGAAPLLSLAFRDITDDLAARRRLQDAAGELARLADTDPLTGLLNRRGWQTGLTRALGRLEREPEGGQLGVAIADLDQFKAYNDQRGHGAGDDLLVELARRWSAAVGASTVLARLGGEEFGLLLPGVSIASGRERLEQLRALVPEAQTVSAGLTLAIVGEEERSLMARADAALYAAKRAGRDRVEALVAA